MQVKSSSKKTTPVVLKVTSLAVQMDNPYMMPQVQKMTTGQF